MPDTNTDNRIAGVAFCTYDGKTLTLGQGTARVDVQETECEGVPSAEGGGAGYVERGVVPEIEIEGLAVNAVNIEELQAVRKSTIVFQLGNGWSAVLEEAWVMGRIPVDATAGTYQVTFQGKRGHWE